MILKNWLSIFVFICPIWVFGQTALPSCQGKSISAWDRCQGSHIFKAGHYQGEWRNGKPDGQGEFIFANGIRSVGAFKEGLRNGQVVSQFPDGQRYEGGYRNGRKDGKGELIRKDGTITSGYWQLGKYLGSEAPAVTAGASRIPLIQGRGTFRVTATINDLATLDFMVDSGAAVVTVPANTVQKLIASGSVTEADFRGSKSFVLADGSRVKARTFLIRKLQVGDQVVNDVTASEFAGSGRPLLGQSFLKRFKSWSIDNSTHELVLQ